MMPKKAPEKKRSIIIGVKVDPTTKVKLKYLADMERESISTYIYNQIVKHIEEKEPWITREIADQAEENSK